VTIVGGGYGVSTVVAARHAEAVTVYEGGAEWAMKVDQTASTNEVSDRVIVRNEVVGEANDVYGETMGNVIPPEQLPECDVLELDCEGAEEEIINDMGLSPRVIIVEMHPSKTRCGHAVHEG
jgi:hypothetical protein